ncbi:MAG: hypothetical protein AMR96_06960 [Candidatus Adiutrix intracellularis]|nr:MAG: hypothetical protein AMR96_06960 [Candidatus Adiutrix intracellularis]
MERPYWEASVEWVKIISKVKFIVTASLEIVTLAGDLKIISYYIYQGGAWIRVVAIYNLDFTLIAAIINLELAFDALSGSSPLGRGT